jgi:hypothetical protein
MSSLKGLYIKMEEEESANPALKDIQESIKL